VDDGMQGVFLTDQQQIAIHDVLAAPECPPDGVLIRLRACGVCGGDLKRYRYFEGPYPNFMGGHEYAGEVIEGGPDVRGFQPGDRVANCFGNFCGLCTNCLLGSPNFCTGIPRLRNAGGGFAEFVARLTPERGCGLFRLPEDLSFEHAAVCEPADCAIGAALRGRPEVGQWAAVVGLGAMGHFVSQTLFGLGVKVIGIDVSENRLRAATPFCAEVVNSSTQEPVAAVREITGGIGVDRAYEVVGIEPTFAAALQMTRMGGTAVLVGVFRAPMQAFDPEWLFRRDLTVIAAKGPRPLLTAQGESTVLDFIKRKIIRPETVVTTFPLAKAAEAFAAQASSECLKAVIVPE
jgi:L-iditol 2-dehydrogenase